jgi:formylglycine-generating enzyme required for sulfatase activity
VASGAQEVPVGGKLYYDKWTFPLTDGSRATFLLLRPMTPDGPKAFYVLEHKVWNAFVQDFVKENAGAIDTAKWKGGHDMLPAVNLTFAEAEKFAKWLGGRLPTTAEWDFAAGFNPKLPRPLSTGNPRAIASATLIPVNEDPEDISPMKVRNMAANGREFTTDTVIAGSEKMVVLRGRMFTLSKPLSFDDLLAEQKDERKQTQYPDARHPQTGFRVVIDLLQ